MKDTGHSQKLIAEAIGKDKSVVSRELKRNRDLRSGEYRSDLANRKYVERQKSKQKQKRFTEEIKTEVKLGLE
jgi:IS30 family transposase